MSQAASVISVIPDVLSSGMLKDLVLSDFIRIEEAHFRLSRLRSLLDTLREVEYDDPRTDELLANLHDQVDSIMLLTGGEARLIRTESVLKAAARQRRGGVA